MPDRFTVTAPDDGMRLDKYLVAQLPDLSRSRIKSIIDQGGVRVNGAATHAAFKLKADMVIEITMPEIEDSAIIPQDIALDIIYEDEHLLVINKPPGLVVHPAAGNRDGTLVNALLHHCGESLSGIGGVARPGIVHRLDKETSGLMLVAKNDTAHNHLSAQLKNRTLSRTYEALVIGIPLPPKGIIDAPIDRDPKNRLKKAIRASGRTARTHYQVAERYREAFAAVTCKLETGRTHQIRLHMLHYGFPLIGDPLYGPQPTKFAAILKRCQYTEDEIAYCTSFGRQALHAQHIAFVHPLSETVLEFDVPPPDDYQKLRDILALSPLQ